MYPKAWDIYTFCAQTSILGFEQSGVGLVSLYYKKNEFENYDNEYQSFSKNDRYVIVFSDLDEWISQGKYCITDNAIH